jgi:GWxTD domain-containing protein
VVVSRNLTMTRNLLTYKLFAIGLLLIMLHSCRSIEYASSINLSQSYDIVAGRPDASFRIYTPNDTVVKIYMRLPLAPPSEDWDAQYALISGYYSAQLLDTGRLGLMKEDDLHQVLQATLTHEASKDFLLRVELQSSPRGQKFSYIINLYTAKPLGPHSILPILQDGSVWFHDYLPQGLPIRLLCADGFQSEHLTINYYHEFHSLAAPPFSSVAFPTFNLKPDSSFRVVVSKNMSDTFSLQGQGLYHIPVEPASRIGLSLIRPVNGYPFLNSAEQMIHCARYIMTNKEFRNCIEAADKKTAIDAFWLDISGNPARARSMMADYYRRVEEANKLFVSDTEGWKTDRGMIYIIFGPPDIANRSDRIETWTYGEMGYSRSLVFQFRKYDNPFSDMDYRLERLPNYKDPWYTAVNQWRR